MERWSSGLGALAFVVTAASWGCAGTKVEEPSRVAQRRTAQLPTVTSPLTRAATDRLGREMDSEKPQRLLREPLSPPEVDLEDLQVVGSSSGPVPDFELMLADGEVFRSTEWVGRRPFVIVFFATWCQVCEVKMPLVRAALEGEREVTLLLVSVDEPDTWRHVPGFIREQRLGEALLASGLENPRFTLGYDPMGAVPVVAVVGRDGTLVDYQVGLSPADGGRLTSAVRRAAGHAPSLVGGSLDLP